LELLKFLAAEKALQGVYDKAKEKSMEQYQKKQAAKAKTASEGAGKA